MDKVKKVTMILPESLVEQALKASQKSLTETVRMGLQLIVAKGVNQEILSWRGKYKFNLDLKKLRDN